MAKIVERAPKVGKGEPLKLKRVRSGQTGELVTIRTVNADSKTFASDLSHAFRSNVAAALQKKK